MLLLNGSYIEIYARFLIHENIDKEYDALYVYISAWSFIKDDVYASMIWFDDQYLTFIF